LSSKKQAESGVVNVMKPPQKVFNEETFLHKSPIRSIPEEKRFLTNDEILNHTYVFHVDELYHHFKEKGQWVNPYTNKKFEERDQLILRKHKHFQELHIAQNVTQQNYFMDTLLRIFPPGSVNIQPDLQNNMLHLHFKNSALLATANMTLTDDSNVSHFAETKMEHYFPLFLSDKIKNMLEMETELQELREKIMRYYSEEEKIRIRETITHFDQEYPEAMQHFKEDIDELVLRVLKHTHYEELFQISQEFDKMQDEIKVFHDTIKLCGNV
jgi:hypothetical protein